MATTVNKIQNYVNQYIGDTGTVSVSANDRLRAISEAVRTLYDEFEFNFTNRTYEFYYFDTVHWYDLTSNVPDFTVPVDIRREEDYHSETFQRKTPRELAIEIEEGATEPSFAIETKDQKVWLGINFSPRFTATTLHNCDSVDGNGTWTVDSSNSDATNLTKDDDEYKEGSACLNFDVDVSQSANNRATIYVDDMAEVDCSDEEETGSFICWVYFPDATYITSVTVYWGSSSTAYWSGTATTDIDGNSFTDGWNRIKVDWVDASKTGSPDSSAITYLRIDINYSASQGDDTDFRVDEILMVKPEKLTFHYQSWYIGKDSSGNYLTEFSSTDDVPFYSGVYDYFDVYVAHKAAAILFKQMGMRQDAVDEEALAQRELRKLKKKFPSSKLSTTKNFKVRLNW